VWIFNFVSWNAQHVLGNEMSGVWLQMMQPMMLCWPLMAIHRARILVLVL